MEILTVLIWDMLRMILSSLYSTYNIQEADSVQQKCLQPRNAEMPTNPSLLHVVFCDGTRYRRLS